jgi:uncharacterized protein YjbJ (UPF0337 family)
MDKDRIKGSAENTLKARPKSLAAAEGKMDQVEGKVQNTVGGMKDSVKEKNQDDAA